MNMIFAFLFRLRLFADQPEDDNDEAQLANHNVTGSVGLAARGSMKKKQPPGQAEESKG